MVLAIVGIYILGTLIGCFRIGQIQHRYFDTSELYANAIAWPVLLLITILSLPWQLAKFLGEKSR